MMILKLLNSVCRGWVQEHRFKPPRRWKFDYANPGLMIAIEIEGGVWSNGRHTRGKGYVMDMEKYNAATLLGWRLLRYTPQQTDIMLDDIRMIADKQQKQRKQP